MLELFESLRQFNLVSVVLRLSLSILFGGIIGMERGRKHRAAGFRTYMLVCMGATMTMLLGLYERELLIGPWSAIAQEVGVRADVSRIGAQVINGIGFLGAGTIIVTGRQEVKGLTTAAGLWASACMGLAIGAGFYECVFLAFLLIFLCIGLLPNIENYIIQHARNINLYIEFLSLDQLGDIIGHIKGLNAQIYEVDIAHGQQEYAVQPSAVFSLRLPPKVHHEQFMADISELRDITAIDEL